MGQHLQNEYEKSKTKKLVRPKYKALYKNAKEEAEYHQIGYDELKARRSRAIDFLASYSLLITIIAIIGWIH